MSAPAGAARTAEPTAVRPVLQARDVAVHFGGVRAVDGVSLDLGPGAVFGLLGPNGSGKSTLLSALTRLVPLTRGTLIFESREFQTVGPAEVARLGVARTFQTVRLLPRLTVRQNVQLGADILPRAQRADGQIVQESIGRTGLGGYESLLPSELSYGTQRRVEIARAIAMRPRMLLLDEPTAGMTHSERAEISQLLRSLRSEGITQLLVEHDVQMMMETCDYIFAMNQGLVIAQGTPQEVVRNPLVKEAYLGKRWQEHA